MLDRLRKRFGSLLSAKSGSVAEEEPPDELDDLDAPPEPPEPEKATDVEAVLMARREAQKRESRFILSERIHNRAAGLLNEVRNELLQEIHRRLEDEVQDARLHTLLQVTLDTGFTERLDTYIDELVEKLLEKLRASFEKEPECVHLLPKGDGFALELKGYRDEILRKHLLEQIEVLALPTSTQVFQFEKGSADELKERVAQYWMSCREALEKFFRSVEMVLLDGAREGLRLDADLIRDCLVAAQYRNGYRLLDDRFRHIYGEVAKLHMSAEVEARKRAEIDRAVVDEIIVPLAYFIRERSEPEPREALASRAELFGEIIDKLVAVPEPFHQTAEAIKPVLRKSVEQARPLAIEDYPFLRTAIESLNPTAIHRTTALLKVFETLVLPDLHEKDLKNVEQIIRLNRAQYRLFQQLERSYPQLLPTLEPLDRVSDEDATFLASLVEQAEPAPELVSDLFLSLDYLEWPQPLPEDPRVLLRYVAVLALSPNELTAWSSLYLPDPPSASERDRLASELVSRLGRSSVGTNALQARLGATPLPIDLSKALASMGYRPEDRDRLAHFQEELQRAVQGGGAEELSEAIRQTRRLRRAVENERIAVGVTNFDADPYMVELWVTERGVMVGLVLYKGTGVGTVPVESISRDPSGGNRKEIEEKLRRQLQNQAVIYQTFHKLFSRRGLVPKESRRQLPSFVKKLYEPTEPNRLLLLSRLRYAQELIVKMNEFAKLVVEIEPNATTDARAVLQVLAGLAKKVGELSRTTERTRDAAELARLVKEYERALKYLNTVVVHSINPWLSHQTRDVGNEFEFDKGEVELAVRRYATQHGLDWNQDVQGLEAHGIRGTLGCRALLKLSDGSSKVILLNYDRRHQKWQIRHIGPRLTDVVREALGQHGKSLPDDYDEKFEQPTFSLDEQSCRFLYVKRDVARVEATLVLDFSHAENPWRVVYLKHNDDVLTDRLS